MSDEEEDIRTWSPIPTTHICQLNVRTASAPLDSERQRQLNTTQCPQPIETFDNSQNIAIEQPILLQKWNEYVRDQAELHGKQIRTDELRRRVHTKYAVVAQQMKEFVASMQGVSYPSTGNASGELSTLSQDISSKMAQLEQPQAELDVAEGEILELEAKIRAFLPQVQNSAAQISPEFLVRNGVRFSLSEADDESPSLFSDGDAGDDDHVRQIRQYYAKLDEVGTIEDQIVELWDEESKLRGTDEADLDQKAREFLQSYPSEIDRLSAVLEVAKEELAELKHQLEASDTTSNRSVRFGTTNKRNRTRAEETLEEAAHRFKTESRMI